MYRGDRVACLAGKVWRSFDPDRLWPIAHSAGGLCLRQWFNLRESSTGEWLFLSETGRSLRFDFAICGRL